MQKGFIEEVDPCLNFEGKVREWEVSHSRRKEELGGSWRARRKGVILGMCYLDKARQSHRKRVTLRSGRSTLHQWKWLWYCVF